MTQRPLRWGVLGAAKIAVGKVIPALQKAKGCELLALASRDRARASEICEPLGISRVYDGYEALLDDEDIDAVYIPLPNHLHAPWTIRSARAGKHVLCEKPMALNSREAKTMVDECRSAGVLLMEAFMYRLHPQWVRVRELLESGELGELMAVQSFFSYRNLNPNDIRNTPEYGGGGLMDIGCYCINLSRMLFGREPVRVAGSIDRCPNFGVDRLASGVLDFAPGQATFSCATQLEPDQRAHMIGTEARLEVEIPFNIPPDRPTHLFLTAGGDPPVNPSTRVIEIEAADQYTVQAECFAEAVRTRGKVPIPPEDGIANLRVMEELVRDSQEAGPYPGAGDPSS